MLTGCPTFVMVVDREKQGVGREGDCIGEDVVGEDFIAEDVVGEDVVGEDVVEVLVESLRRRSQSRFSG